VELKLEDVIRDLIDPELAKRIDTPDPALIKPRILEAVPHNKGMQVTLDPGAAIPHGAVLAHVVEEGSKRHVDLYHAEADTAVFFARRTERITLEDDTSSILPPDLLLAPHRSVALLSPDLSGVLSFWREGGSWEDVEMRIIQNGSRCRALLIPIAAEIHHSLPSGTYRLRFQLQRARWQTTDSNEPRSRYAAAATISLSLGN
jgi:hypothetical protein